MRDFRPGEIMQHVTSTVDLTTQKKHQDWTLLYFSASWCGPCKTMSPVMDRVSQHNEAHLSVLKVDVDQAPSLAKQYGIRSIPTLVLVHKEQAVETLVGSHPQPKIQQWLSQHL